MPSGFTAALSTDALLDVGVLTRTVSATVTPLGVSRGGLSFTPSIEMRNIEFDGKRSDIEGLDRITKRGGTISGTFLQAGVANFAIFEPGSTDAVASLVNTITPKAASTTLAAGDYIDNLTLTFRRADGGTEAVIFAKALCTKYDLKSTDNGEVEIACEFSARLSATAAATSTDASPYVIKITTAA